MSTTTLSRSDRMNVALFSGSTFAPANVGTEVFKKDNGVVVVKRKPVFRSGTFRDSMGVQSTWEGLHIDMMKSHFDMLRNRNILKDVPVRDGHPGWLIHGLEGNGKVIGWHTDLTSEEIDIEQGKFQFLLADYELTDPEAQAKEQNGTYRNRSSEIGEYTTNDEAMFWPVYMGVAMVDFSAVEGLNFSKLFSQGSVQESEGRVFHVFMDEKEAPPVSGANTNGSTVTPPAVVAPVVPAVPAVPGADQQHAAPAAPAFQFSVNGNLTADFAAVQAHITALEGFRKETEDAAVESFVDGLVSGNKLLASQKVATVAWAKTQSAEQFAAWKEIQEGVPAHPIVGQSFGNFNGSSEGNGSPQQAAASNVLAEYETAKAQVAMHTKAGVKQEQLEKMGSYQRMKALEPQVQAAQAQS